MSYSNGIITAPVSIDDIKDALGESNNDLATLCKSDNINMWSLMKPCDYNDMWQMKPYSSYGIPDSHDSNKSNIIMTEQTLVEHNGGTLGITTPLLMRYNKAAEKGIAGYVRQKPRGGSSSPYRIGDFVGYNQNARSPFVIAVSWSNNVANFTVNINNDSTAIKARQFDYNIYKNVIWRIAVAYRRNNTTEDWKLIVPGTDNDYDKPSNGFLQSIIGNNDVYTFNFSAKLYASTTYIFVGLLLGFKVTQNIDANNKPITTTVTAIQASSTDTSRCGIPMPCNNIVSTSGDVPFAVTIGTMYSVRYAPFNDDSVIIGKGNQYFAVIPVTFTAGSSSYDVTNVQVSVNVPGNMLAGLGIIDDFALDAYKSKTINVYYCVGKTGTYDIHFTINNGLMSDKPWSYNSTQTVTISNL